MVEEDEYRSTYLNVNERRCVFEKTILSQCCSCTYSTRFYLADREGIACDSATAHRRCSHLIMLLRENARFALKITTFEGELPHAKEIRVQSGGLLGLQRILRPDLEKINVADIAALMLCHCTGYATGWMNSTRMSGILCAAMQVGDATLIPAQEPRPSISS